MRFTVALFALMQLRVAVDAITIKEPAAGEPIQIRFDVSEIDVRPVRVRPTQIPVAAPPPAPRLDASADTPSQSPTAMPSPPFIDIETAIQTVDVTLPPPLDVRAPPAYPRREQMRGAEGRCTVRYDSLASGAAANIQVLARNRAGFADASIAAVERWRHAARRGEAPEPSDVTRSHDHAGLHAAALK